MSTRRLERPDYWEQAVRRATSRLFLLAALAERPMHGYELVRAVEVLSEQCCSPSDAAMYPALRELEAGGYIECCAEDVAGRQRNVCTLTARGREALATGALAWARVLPSLQRLADAADPCGCDADINQEACACAAGATESTGRNE